MVTSDLITAFLLFIAFIVSTNINGKHNIAYSNYNQTLYSDIHFHCNTDLSSPFSRLYVRVTIQ